MNWASACLRPIALVRAGDSRSRSGSRTRAAIARREPGLDTSKRVISSGDPLHSTAVSDVGAAAVVPSRQPNDLSGFTRTTDNPAMTTTDAPPAENDPLPSSTRAEGDLPPLLRDTSFWGMSATQFLGAFNDNVFKQLLLLLATPTAVEIAAAEAAGETVPDRQAEAMIVFAIAFLVFSGFAGWLADCTSKRTLIIGSKAAEIVVMTLGMVGFLFYGSIGFSGMLVVLFLMGTQSAFFGPPKYGILPEMIRDRDLPQANGIFLMFHVRRDHLRHRPRRTTRGERRHHLAWFGRLHRDRRRRNADEPARTPGATGEPRIAPPRVGLPRAARGDPADPA